MKRSWIVLALFAVALLGCGEGVKEEESIAGDLKKAGLKEVENHGKDGGPKKAAPGSAPAQGKAGAGAPPATQDAPAPGQEGAGN